MKNQHSFKRALRIFRYISPYRGKFFLGLAFLMLGASTFMLFPGLLGRLMGDGAEIDSPLDRVFHIENIDQVALLLLVVFVLQAFFSFMRIYLFADVTERAIATLRQDTYAHLLRLPMTYFSKHRVGELSSRVSNDISQIQETFMTTLAQLVRQTLIIVLGVGLLFFYSLELTLVMLVSLPVMMLLAFFFGKFIRSLSKETQEQLAQSQVAVEETLQGIQSVKSYAMEPFEIARYSRITETVRRIAMRGAKWRGVFASFIVVGLLGAVVLVIWYGVKLKNQGEISMDVLMSFILYSVFVGASIGSFADVFGKIQKTIGSTENLLDILEEESEEMDLNSSSAALSAASVAFDNVSFSYPSRPEKQVLNGLSFSVAEGERVAIVGESGAGKSTVASLLLRLYHADQGTIKVGNIDISNYSLQSLRDGLALVPQEVLLFGGSIKDNIAYGRLGATDKEIRDASEKANALDFIESFPDGFETLVGERGVQLSGGQRQRVAIARAILKDPKILILDEATSSLDAESERVVQEALDRLMDGRTSIVIAHRLSTIRKADKIFVIDHGRVRESGGHEELMQITNGVYRNLSELQVIG